MVSDMCRGVSRIKAFRHARRICTNPEVHTVLGNYTEYLPVASLDAVLCSHAALFCFMNAHTFETAVLSAINLGGDTDTAGACCGAMSGAYWGLEAIPIRWKKDLEDYSHILHCAEQTLEMERRITVNNAGFSGRFNLHQLQRPPFFADIRRFSKDLMNDILLPVNNTIRATKRITPAVGFGAGEFEFDL